MKFELIHDSIAKQIFNKISYDALERRKAENLVKDRFVIYNERRSALTKNDIDFVYPYIDFINLTKEEENFFFTQKAVAEENERIEIRRKKNLRRAAVAVIIVLTTLLGFAIFQLRKAKIEERKALYKTNTTEAQYYFQNNQANNAFRFNLEAYLSDPNASEAQRGMKLILDQREQLIFRPLRTTVSDHQGSAIKTIAFSDRANAILSTSEDGIAKLTNIYTGADEQNMHGDLEAFMPEYTFEGHTKEIVLAGFTAAGGKVFTISKDNTIRIWDENANQINQRDFPAGQNIVDAILSPGMGFGQVLVITEDAQTQDAGLYMFEIIFDELRLVNQAKPQKGEVKFAEFSADGEFLVVMYPRYVEIRGSDLELKTSTTLLWSVIRTAAISPDGEQLVIAYVGQDAGLWNRNQKSSGGGRPRSFLDKHEGDVNSVCFSNDGELILTASTDQTAGLWNKNGELLHFLQGHTGNVTSARFSSDGKSIFTISEDNTVRLWSFEKDNRIKSGYVVKLEAILSADQDENAASFLDARFSPSASQMGISWIATTTDNGLVQIWDPNPEQLARRMGYEQTTASLMQPDSPLDVSTSEREQLNPEQLDLILFELSKWGVVYPGFEMIKNGQWKIVPKTKNDEG